jgi:signal transduction histidine kinase
MRLDAIGSLADAYRHLSLRAKFAVHVAASVALLFAILVPAVVYIQQRVVLDEVKSRGLQLTKVFAHASVQALVADDFLILRHVIDSIANEPDVLYAMILDPSARLLAHSDMREAGRTYSDPLSGRAARTDGPLVQEIRANGLRAYDFAVPVYVVSERRAVARVAISIGRELDSIRRTRNLVVGIGVLALAAGLALGTWQARSVTSPIGELARSARHIAAGDLDATIPVHVGDEVGQLSAAFNRMAESLKSRRDIDRELSSTLALDAVLHTITRHARALLESDMAHVASLDPASGIATIVAGSGEGSEAVSGLPVDPGIATAYDDALKVAGPASTLAVPISLKGDAIGILYVANRRPTTFRPEDREVLSRLADQAAIALQNARLYGALRESHQALVTAQAELVRQTRMAAIGEIAAAVAHEARNPLGALSNCVQLLRGNPHITGEDAELLDIMKAETQRLNQIVSDFLAFGRPRPPQLQELDLPELIGETLDLLRRDDRCAPAIAFATAFDPSLPPLAADRDQLRQVFWNLFLNAVQAVGERGTLRVEARRLERSVEIAVRDTGPGIATAHLPRIFEPFYSAKPGGTGLGLAIVRRIVEEHGGEVTAESAAGVGTSLVVRFPLAPANGGGRSRPAEA